MPSPRKAWEEHLAQAQDDVIYNAIKFRNKEFELEQRDSSETNEFYGTLFRSIDVLEFVYDSRPVKKVPKLKVVKFAFPSEA